MKSVLIHVDADFHMFSLREFAVFATVMDIKIFKLYLLYICATGALCQKIIVHPKNATVKQGSNITLRCEFDKPVKECFWFRNGKGEGLFWHHQYADAIANGRNTSNCSLFIQGIGYWPGNNDFWYCSNALSSGSKSNIAYLTVVLRVITVQPQNATVVEGDDITLRCEFDVPIKECVWWRHWAKVEIDGRYRYSDATANGTNTKNCSILIKTFGRNDATDWQCSTETQYRLLFSTESKIAHLRIAKNITDYPKNATVLEGADKILLCKFNQAVDSCLWLRNGSTIEIKDRYRYTDCEFKRTNTKDCSIEITQFSEIDATSWQCSTPLNCDIKIETCTSNYAYLTIEYPETMANDNGFVFELNLSTVLTIIMSSTLVIIIITGAIVYYRRRRSKETRVKRHKVHLVQNFTSTPTSRHNRTHQRWFLNKC